MNRFLLGLSECNEIIPLLPVTYVGFTSAQETGRVRRGAGKDTPISENTIIGVAIGAAMGGLRPVVDKRLHRWRLRLSGIELEQQPRIVVAIHRLPRVSSSNSLVPVPLHPACQTLRARATKSGNSIAVGTAGGN